MLRAIPEKDKKRKLRNKKEYANDKKNKNNKPGVWLSTPSS